MAHIIGVGTAVPAYEVYQEQVRDYVVQHFKPYLPRIERLATVFKHAAIDTRYFVVPNDWWDSAEHSLQERNDVYVREATLLAQRAILAALDAAELKPQQVDNLIFVSSSGFATPSLDAVLINCLGMRRDVRRIPIWGLGCAGGVAGLARAAEMARALPESITVLVAVETCSLTFQFDDPSKKNFIATSLFADGAGAVVVAGAEHTEHGIEIIDSQSTLWPDTLGVMGWRVVNTGLAVILGTEIPAYVTSQLRPEVERFLAKHDLDLEQIEHFVFHPGGAKVIEAYDKALDLSSRVPNGQLDAAREVLRRFGNMSSPTVLFVLDYILRHSKPGTNQYGLMAALGPGFSAEQVLVQFQAEQ
jgi:alkylresorcinol/alkylpyrone synthase